MQTNFSAEQLKDPVLATANQILRRCVHCGFCTATCPTYVLGGDERDSPRGRIYMIKQMFEEGRPADAEIVTHVDRCLSCLACMTTCPSGVHYMHLIDSARAHIEQTYTRPLPERFTRAILAQVLPNPGLFRLSLHGANLARPIAGLLPRQFRAMVEMAPRRVPRPSPSSKPGVHVPTIKKIKRVALLVGCAQTVLDPEINEATIRLLNRHGIEVVVAEGAGCCGSLTHHLGMKDKAHMAAGANINAWIREMDGEGLDAIVINTSGCGTTVKDYGHMFEQDKALAGPAKRVAAITKDITEIMAEIDLVTPTIPAGRKVTYHSACSLQHGQRLNTGAVALLKAVGFTVKLPAEGHLCCGSAGTYNLLQPEIAGQLKARKLANIEATEPEIIAAGNIGCISQIGSGTKVPIVHTAQLLDWATGGPVPGPVAAVDNS